MQYSSISPQSIELITITNNEAYFKLRKNIKNIMVTNDISNQNLTLYQYDELPLKLNYTSTIAKEIKENFSLYWEIAEAQEKERQENERKKQEMNKLINQMEQVEVNKEIKIGQETTFLSIAELYEKNLQLLKDKGELLKRNTELLKENNNNSLAISELYEKFLMLETVK